MRMQLLFFVTVTYLHYLLEKCGSQRVTYIINERPVVEYTNKQYFGNVTMNSKRLTRKDPRFYVNLYSVNKFTAGNNLKLDFYFYEFVQTNKYRRSFLEMHFKFCDMLENDLLFGSVLKRQLFTKNRTCPFPPGEYHLTNLSLPYLPTGLPFTRGRIYCNLSIDQDNAVLPIAQGYIDMEIKTMTLKNKKQ